MGDQNRDRARAKARNAMAEAEGRAGRVDLGNGLTMTVNPCSDRRYVGRRYVFVSITGPSVHDTAIFDQETNSFVND